MGKLLKLLGIVVVLVIAVLLILPFVIDPNDYRDEIVSAVEKQTGRELTIDGDLGLTVFPWIGVDIGKLQLGNAKGFGEAPFAAIEQASVRVKLLPLLSSKLEADTITLDGLQLNLAKNADGVTNWDDLTSPAASDTGTNTEPTDSDGKKSTGLSGLSIGGISINNATIRWQDDMSGQSYQVDDFNLNSGAIAPGDPVDLELGMTLTGEQPKLTANLALAGKVAMDDAMQQLAITPLTVEVDASGDMFSNGQLQAALRSNVSVNLEDLAVKLDALKLTSGDLDLSGELALNNLADAPAVAGQLQLAELNLRNWLADQGMALPPMGSEQAMTRFSASASMSSSGNSTSIDKLSVTLDESKIDGSASLAGEKIGFDLAIDRINLDHYLPPASEETSANESSSSESTVGQSSASPTDEALLPVDTLRALAIDGKLAINSLTASKLLFEQVTTIIKASNGVIRVNPSIGKFYQGSFNANSTVNVTGNTPKMALDAKLQNLQAGPLLKDLTGQDRLTGQGRFSADLNTSGNSMAAIKKGLGGKLDFRFADGAVKGINLAKLIRETRAKFEGKSAKATNEPEQTDFSELSGSANIKQGVLTNNDLLAKSPYLRVSGAGKVNLPAETLDYTIETRIVSTAKGQGGEELKDLEGLNVPVKLTGSLLAPKYSVDWGKVLVSSQKAKVDEKVKEKKKDLEKKIEDKLGDKLKGFF